ncbi:hypothetical protein H9L09_05075 [Nocardioides mesophilus]|uniref:Uncharacterized protein n=1 Tax=Nocardioides mesophilus TaxID=433659 RepID=A0A7G9RHZ0_9ACTN|nr:hypothetical protein [Nocardioides mesophilus]QNN55215.1 hypothetical protein H9L09_05075 [Nocardioides mesophilus]
MEAGQRGRDAGAALRETGERGVVGPEAGVDHPDHGAPAGPVGAAGRGPDAVAAVEAEIAAGVAVGAVGGAALDEQHLGHPAQRLDLALVEEGGEAVERGGVAVGHLGVADPREQAVLARQQAPAQPGHGGTGAVEPLPGRRPGGRVGGRGPADEGDDVQPGEVGARRRAGGDREGGRSAGLVGRGGGGGERRQLRRQQHEPQDQGRQVPEPVRVRAHGDTFLVVTRDGNGSPSSQGVRGISMRTPISGIPGPAPTLGR